MKSTIKNLLLLMMFITGTAFIHGMEGGGAAGSSESARVEGGEGAAEETSENVQEDACAICFESLSRSRVLQIAYCGNHVFHHACLDTWYETVAPQQVPEDIRIQLLTCPTCRASWFVMNVLKEASVGNYEYVRGLLATKPEILEYQQAQDLNNRTLLHYAAYFGWSDIVELLIGKNFDVNAVDDQYRTPLHYALGADLAPGYNLEREAAAFAMLEGRMNIIEMLLAAGADCNLCDSFGVTPLMRAALPERPLLCMLMLLEKGADIDAVDIYGCTVLLHLLHAMRVPDAEKVWLVLEYNKKREGDVAKTFINKKKRVSGITALHIATSSGYGSICFMLLHNGAFVDSEDRNGATPLMYATVKGDVGVSEMLIAYKANVNIQYWELQEDTVLHQAALKGFLLLISLFIKRGCNVNAIASDGNTPLHCAVLKGYIDCVKMLLAAGASALIQNNAGETPYDIAQKPGFERIAQMLRDAMVAQGAQIVGPTGGEAALAVGASGGAQGHS